MKKNVLINTNVLNVYVNRITASIFGIILALSLLLVCNPFVNIFLLCIALLGCMYVFALIQELKLSVGERVFKGKLLKWINNIFE